MGNSARLGGGTWRPPDSFRFEHRVENEEQLVHRGDQRHFGRFAEVAKRKIGQYQQVRFGARSLLLEVHLTYRRMPADFLRSGQFLTNNALN